MNRISARKAIVGAVVLFVMVPILLQPIRPWLVSLPLPQPTLWQSAVMFIGQFLVAAVGVAWWNERAQRKDAERERDRVKFSGGLADD
jgi:hypothetical protein